MNESQLFHPVACADALGERPIAAHLMGHDLVLWRDSAGAVHAGADRCPHRGAALSLGRVQGDTLECAYHGWRFDARGRCVAVPALPEFVPPASHRACIHDAREAYGLIWVRLHSAEAADTPSPLWGEGRGEGPRLADLPRFAAEDEPHLRKLLCGPYDVATSAPRLIENFLDMSHFAFVHEGLLGARAFTSVAPHAIEFTAGGFIASGCKAWQPRSTLKANEGAMIDYTYEVASPFNCVLTKRAESAPEAERESIAMFICPLAPERSRVWMRLAVVDFVASDASLRAFQDTIFAQDLPVLESQRPRLLPISAEAPVTELHSAADRSSAAYRRCLRERGITFGVC